MCDYIESSQAGKWLFQSEEQLKNCREKASKKAIAFLQSLATSSTPTKPPVLRFAFGYSEGKTESMTTDNGESGSSSMYLTANEELHLVDFYAGKLPSLIGPKAQVPRLTRDSKVAATAVLLYRRFYLSNSVMVFDPKEIMTAAAFLASKVEDAMTDIRYLEEGTKVMNAPVTQSAILASELVLLEGINFDLLCFHPFKAVLAFTQDLRQFVKTKVGRGLVQLITAQEKDRPVVGQDLKELHDASLKRLNEICILSDLPLLYSPGKVGLACMMVANERSCKTIKVDLMGYIEHRFAHYQPKELAELKAKLPEVCAMIVRLSSGEKTNYFTDPDLIVLKAIHKKLKKCRIWGEKKDKKKSKKNKRKAEEQDGNGSKKAKTEA
uniref:Cyclin-like domain-containing protein n=1 Tax=Grammatophora oceanica TaxID=210454 RepID=A0A7S1XZY2_9STRA|mmetsp:Transcript_10531/g.15344  ORF Transcript_10531/g.15344 Transcript_10531/m.15344 type:complete len:381 (+) Transcript_10531:91-1233(+)